MTCITPSHEEKIEEGISCTLEDTLRALEETTQQSREEVCLLGEEQDTPGKSIEVKMVAAAENRRKPSSLEFLRAQMHKDYRSSLPPSLRGGKETEEVVEKNPPLPMITTTFAMTNPRRAYEEPSEGPSFIVVPTERGGRRDVLASIKNQRFVV